jgi:hypothetical protein
MMQAFPTLAASRSGQGTLLSGSLPDQCALYGVIDQLEALGLQLPEIRRLANRRSRMTDATAACPYAPTDVTSVLHRR